MPGLLETILRPWLIMSMTSLILITHTYLDCSIHGQYFALSPVGTCYVKSETAKLPIDAKQDCLDRNGHLAQLDQLDKFDAARVAVAKDPLEACYYNNVLRYYTIGLEKIGTDWVWHNQSILTEPTGNNGSWHPNAPISFGGDIASWRCDGRSNATMNNNLLFNGLATIAVDYLCEFDPIEIYEMPSGSAACELPTTGYKRTVQHKLTDDTRLNLHNNITSPTTLHCRLVQTCQKNDLSPFHVSFRMDFTTGLQWTFARGM